MFHLYKKTTAIAVLAASLFVGANAHAGWVASTGHVEKISVWGGNGGILVQLNPRPNIQNLNCTDDYWLFFTSTDGGYDAMLKLLTEAQASVKEVEVRADDTNMSSDDRFCRLTRVILQN